MESFVTCFNEFNIMTPHYKPIAFSNDRCFVVDDSQSIQVHNIASISDFYDADVKEKKDCKSDATENCGGKFGGF